MSNYLIDYIANNIWCNPRQDNQIPLKVKRVTNRLGVLNRFKLMERTIETPTTGLRYHIFQVGQINPDMLGLIGNSPNWITQRWLKFSDTINQLNVYVNIYNINGIEIPKHQSYYMLTNDRTLIFAISSNDKIPIGFGIEDIYFRFYTNAYFQSDRADVGTEYLYCKGDTIRDSTHLLQIRNEFDTYAAKDGYVFCYRNGMNVDRLDSFTMHVGDVVEFIYDSSVKRLVTFNVSQLNSFESILDNKFKYLLHYNDGLNDNIDYQDDIEIHILGPVVTSRYEGCYYSRNSRDSHRMVTHRDYSIPVDYFTYLANNVMQRISEIPLNLLSFQVRVAIRDAGYYRPLVYENSRLFELYKLNDSLALDAMLGVNSSMVDWKAEELENNNYTKIMRSKYSDLTLELAQSALGYNSISKLVGDTPTKTIAGSGLQTAELKTNLRMNSTVYEYDENGYLLEVHYHNSGMTYDSTNANTRMIEAITGKGSVKPNVKFGTDNITVPSTYNYRVYRCYTSSGVPDNNWEDITGSEYYHVTNNVLIWNNLDSNQFLMIRDDSSFLDYDLVLNPVAGTLFFTLTETEDRGNGDLNYVLPVPLGELDIFLNGKSLIRGLDYVIHFPIVYIINKEFLVQPADTMPQNVHVRFTGFCKSDLTMDDIEEFGYIEHGFLSNNSKHDIRDDKVLRIITNGKTMHRDDLSFSELHDGISVTNPINGHPYQIKDIVVPLRSVVDGDTYNMRESSILIDNRVSDYLTIKLPQPERNAISAITERYNLYSPFFSRIISGLVDNTIDNAIFTESLSDMDILDVCKQFEHILAFDPINEENTEVNNKYVLIQPHIKNTTVALSIYKYRFLVRVVKLYGNNLIDISSSVTVV